MIEVGKVFVLVLALLIISTALLTDVIEPPSRVSRFGNFSCRMPCVQVSYNDQPLWHIDYYKRIGCNLGMADPGLTAKAIKMHSLPWSAIQMTTTTLLVYCFNDSFYETFGESINNDSFSHLNQLIHLDISDCHVPILDSRSFKGLIRLSVLFIWRTNIQMIKHGFMENLPQLYWLKLNSDQIKVISPYAFTGNSKLLFLQLRFNSISSLQLEEYEEKIDKETLSLNSFVLAQNDIGHLDDKSLVGYNVFGILDLGHCNIRNISENAFRSLPELTGIDLSFNNLSDIRNNIFSPCNRSLQLIELTGNQVHSLNLEKQFPGLNSLTHFHLNKNTIRSIKGNFSMFPRLFHLDISENSMRIIRSNILQNTSRLHSLFLHNNRITNISEDAFSGCLSLQFLNLSINLLESLSPTTFSEMPELLDLNLSNNKLRFLYQNTFSMCRKLLVLNLSMNLLHFVTSGALQGLFSLQLLDVSFNKIEEISRDAFSRCDQKLRCKQMEATPPLKYFNVSNNRLRVIELTLDTHDLVSVNVSNNFLHTIDKKMFSKCSNLTSLSVRFNTISYIPLEVSDTNFPNLTYLDFGFNKLISLKSEALVRMTSLQEVYLDNNMIKTIATKSLQKLTKLKIFHLRNNSLSCRCSLLDFKDWTSSMSFRIKMDNITCTKSDQSRMNLNDVNLEFCRYLIQNIVIGVSVAVVVFCVSTVIIYRFRLEIQVIIYCKWGIRFRFCQKPDDGSFSHDGFVSFVHTDDQFVLNELMTFLENHHGYKLLIHYRDFEVGVDISDNIIKSIDDSARIIIILSEAFLESHWGAFEFEQAFYSILKRRNQRLIVLVMDDQVLNNPSNNIVKKIIATKTYLKRKDKLFWEKIVFAMPDRQSSRHRHSTEELLGNEDT